MPFFDADPVARAATPDEPQISASLQISKTTAKLRLSFNATAQARWFGGSIIGKSFAVAIGAAQDEGRLQITPDPGGAFEAMAFLTYGGASISINRWDNLPRAPRKGPVEFVSEQDGAITLQLPPWARPDGPGGKLAKPGVTSLAGQGRAKARGL